MNEIECPYCGKEQDVCHDDGFGYDENTKHETECIDCEKMFTFETFITFSYDTHKADCLNGEPHKLKPVCHIPECWPDWVQCEDCEYEEKGKFVEEAI